MADGASPAGGVRPEKVGVVVVHGVGETELGYAVNTLVATLKAEVPAYDVAPNSTIVRCVDEEAPEPLSNRSGAVERPYFRVVRRDATHADGTKVSFHELYWADLTNVERGRINTILGIFRVIFESHHLVHAMLDRGGDKLTALLRRLLMAAGWLMRGPMAGLTIATSAMCALLLFGPVTPGGLTPDLISVKFQALNWALFAGALIMLIYVIQTRDVSWYDTAFWVAVVTALLATVEYFYRLPELVQWMPWVHQGCFEPSPKLIAAFKSTADKLQEALRNGCYVNGPYGFIKYGWHLWSMLMLASFAILGLLLLRKARHGDDGAAGAAATSIGIVILQFMLWTILVVSTIFPLLNRAESVSDLLSFKGAIAEKGIDIEKLAKGDGAIAKILLFPGVDLRWVDRFKFVYGATAMMLVGLILLALIILIRRRWIASRGGKDLAAAHKKMPRLLFSNTLVAWLMLALGFIVAFILRATDYVIGDDGKTFDELKSAMLWLAAAAAFATPLLISERVSNGVHIARDLIDHHFLPRLEMGTFFLPRFFRSKSVYPRRSRIQARLESVMERLCREGPYDRLIVLGHSQGSIVVYDYLLRRYPYVAALTRTRPSLMTFGSPICSIYQRYYREYGLVAKSPGEFTGKLAQWVNLYRIDDYVGAPIEHAEGTVENIPMRRGGHMNYWREPELARILDRLIRGERAAGSGAQAAAA